MSTRAAARAGRECGDGLETTERRPAERLDGPGWGGVLHAVIRDGAPALVQKSSKVVGAVAGDRQARALLRAIRANVAITATAPVVVEA